MKLRKLHAFLLLLSLPFLQGTQCDRYDGYEDIKPEHTFKENASLSPYRLAYNVGDTIWLRVNIPAKKLFDEKTGTRIFFDSALFKSYAQVQLLYSNPYLGDGPFARFVFPTGISAYTNDYMYQTQAFVEFGCAPSSDYNFLLGMVLLKQGVFGVSFSNTSVERCRTTTYNYSTLTFQFDVADTHKQQYLELPFDSIGKKPDDNVLYQLEQKSMVVITVQ